MLVGSDPLWVAEKLDELWLSLPGPLREKIESFEVDKIYETLREYQPEIVDRILKSVAEDAAGAQKKWCLEFWEEIKNPDEEEGDGGDDAGEEEPVPEPAPSESEA